jgi:hypothetical protein
VTGSSDITDDVKQIANESSDQCEYSISEISDDHRYLFSEEERTTEGSHASRDLLIVKDDRDRDHNLDEDHTEELKSVVAASQQKPVNCDIVLVRPLPPMDGGGRVHPTAVEGIRQRKYKTLTTIQKSNLLIDS